MKKLAVFETFAALTLFSMMLTGCEAIKGIFNAGVGVGIIIAIVVVFILIKVFGGSKK
ncbi:hypothetical protein BH10BAC2_BH10BAC2_39680 [soil metagenome]